MNRQGRPQQNGFTLIEIMITLAIIAIMIAIAVPNLVNARKAGNESAAISALRSVGSAQTRYRLRFGTYAPLAQLTLSGVLDDSFADSLRSGYVFAEPGPVTAFIWSLGAAPLRPGFSGDRYFLVDESGVIRQREGAAATTADPPIQ